jgi:hypothetical protein
MNPILLMKVGGIALVLVLVFFGGKKIERNYWLEREVEIQKQVQRQLAEAQAKSDSISASFEEYRSKATKVRDNITKELSNEIKTNPAKYGCVIPDSGLRIINGAVREANSSTKP